ncbi:MAG: hypothetical protein GY861_13895 [bacterium]|nr:hypothetical protein [bacterium]
MKTEVLKEIYNTYSAHVSPVRRAIGAIEDSLEICGYTELDAEIIDIKRAMQAITRKFKTLIEGKK